MQIAEDGWLSERYGHPAFTVRTPEGSEDAAGQIQEHAERHGPASYHARVPSERTEAAALLAGAGFAVVSASLTLGRDPGEADGVQAGGAPTGLEVRPARPDADRAAVEIAGRALTKTRFHLDPAIPAAVASRVKRDWAENSLTGERGDGMLVAERGGRVVGFLAGLSQGSGGGRAHVIDLIAVDEPARGAGAGAALVRHFLGESSEFDQVRVSTQGANPEATRFYERLGFTTLAAAYDLHLHTGDPWTAH